MQSQPPEPHVRLASWKADRAALCMIREQVFIREQHVPVALEWDGEDESAMHLLAENAAGQAIGTARLLADGHIGRVAVLKPWRHRGVGSALMRQMLQLAKSMGHGEVFLDAQLDAIGFYLGFGFVVEGEVFMDAGIPHRHMQRKLEDGQGSE